MDMTISLLTASMILSVFGAFTGLCAIILVIAQRMSTHKVEWRTVGFEQGQSLQELEKALGKEEEDLFYDQV
jgi:hypothetical protein